LFRANAFMIANIKNQSYRAEKGFTLVELSIVIVIIGLIVAGVIGGQSLVHQAKLKKIATDVTKYKVAINTFKLEYDAIPGDFSNAYAYWGNSCAGNANDCNGDGNKAVQYWLDGPNGVESLRAWVHLQLAGLINTNLTGIGVQCNSRGTHAGVNIPKAPIGTGIDASGWEFYSSNAIGGGATGLVIGNKHHPTCWNHTRAFIEAKDAYKIDLKIDDGDPIGGEVGSFHASTLSANANCRNGSDEYNVSYSGIACALYFKTH